MNSTQARVTFYKREIIMKTVIGGVIVIAGVI